METDPRLQPDPPAPKHTATATADLSIALLGDIHCFTRRIMPWQLFSKRILGAMNVWFHRGKDLRMDVLPHMCECIADMRPDAVLSVGDLTMLALEREFEMAKQALNPILDRYRTLMVAGNHDRYTFTASRDKRFEHHFTKHIAISEHSADLSSGLHSLSSNVVLAAIDTAKPNAIGDRGWVSETQLRKLNHFLIGVPDQYAMVVLAHYTIGVPPGNKPERASHRLINEDELIKTLAATNREIIYIHGHVHQPWCYRHPQAPNVVVINTGAPTLASKAYPAGQGLWRLERAANRWQITRYELGEGLNWTTKPVVWPVEPGDVSEV